MHRQKILLRIVVPGRVVAMRMPRNRMLFVRDGIDAGLENALVKRFIFCFGPERGTDD